MAFKYISSDSINVYPTALRGGIDYQSGDTIYDPESRLSTEFNLTNPVNRLTIDGSFVISKEASGSLAFSLNGYYFNIKNLSKLTGQFSSGPIYAHVNISELAQGTYKLKSLLSLEGGSTNLDGTKGFTGVGFDNSSSGGTATLKILDKSGSSWIIPEESKLKFTSDSVMISESKNGTAKSLHDVITVNGNSVELKAEEFKGHLTGDVKGNLTGNADTSTNSSYSAKIGTSTSHPAIGSGVNPVYVDSNGVIKYSSSTVGHQGIDYNQMIYLNNGELKAGMKITFSKNAPTSSDKGNNGDIWFQYV